MHYSKHRYVNKGFFFHIKDCSQFYTFLFFGFCDYRKIFSCRLDTFLCGVVV